MVGLDDVGLVMFGRWEVWGGVGLVLVGTFCWFKVVPGTCLVESKGLGWYLYSLGNKWVVSGWFGVELV